MPITNFLCLLSQHNYNQEFTINNQGLKIDCMFINENNKNFLIQTFQMFNKTYKTKSDEFGKTIIL